MSMDVLTILQFVQILLAYLCMTFLLPAILLYRKIRNENFPVRFMTYQIVGNFFMMNLVFVLELLHISNRFTLTFFTVVLFGAGYVILYRKNPAEAVKKALSTLEKLAKGQLGTRLFLRRVRIAAAKQLKRFILMLFARIRKNFLDILLFLGITASLGYVYGINLLIRYGYCASDILVHNYWINNLVTNKIFVAGIYPYGFHCMIYYLRTVFGIPTYVLLRVFCFVQTMMIHYVLLAFLKSCCKSKYAAYIGLFLYVMADIFGVNTFIRYYSSLPQEFGMLFILPSIYFLYAFFEKREKKAKEDKWYLACFAMSFGMTISAHFYNTMICGLFCLGVAVGYGFRLFRRKYFGKVMLAGILSIVIAVLPMGIAFAMGTPLQGSLGWGLNVITGKNNQKEVKTQSTEYAEEREPDEVTGADEAVTLTKSGEAAASTENDEAAVLTERGRTGSETGDSRTAALTEGGEAADKQSTGQTSAGTNQHVERAEKESLPTRLVRAVKKLPKAVWDALCIYLIPGDFPIFRMAVPGVMALLCVLSILFFLFRQTDYAARLLSTAAYMVLLSVLFGASRAGLPSLMDAIRTCIFYAYSIVMAWSLCIDAVLQLFLGWWKKKRLMNLVSLFLVIAVVFYTVKAGIIKGVSESIVVMQTNAAITCLTNILHDNEDFTWTICSANDELRMGEDYGYHYEVNSFLQEMEHVGNLGSIMIPTSKVYFFIEKIPIDYEKAYERSGQPISKEGAEKPLPGGGRISVYQGENRWIEMSRMYYWAQAFQEKYPNEMKVYYETDDFICYCVEQDMYSLFNFAIDYGYNMTDEQVGQDE